VPVAPNASDKFCAIDVDPSGEPRSVGVCSAACDRAEYTLPPPSATTGCGGECVAGGGATSAPLVLPVHSSGWAGDAGFEDGAEYTLVLFAAADEAEVDVQLHAAGGSFLLAAATFSTDGCGASDATAAPAVRAAADDGAEPPRPQRRPPSWLARLLRHRGGDDDDAAPPTRLKEGEVARWDGATPLRPSADVACAAGVVAAGVRVAVQSECAGDAPTVTTPAPTLRAELGAPFVLSLEHFPLELHVTHARAAAGAAAPPPLLAFAFHTTEVRWASRWALWVGAPLAFLFLACCCCLCVGCCAVAPKGDGEPVAPVNLAATPAGRAAAAAAAAVCSVGRRRTPISGPDTEPLSPGVAMRSEGDSPAVVGGMEAPEWREAPELPRALDFADQGDVDVRV